eukprot:scaffold287499_cov12-Tisochrysis_lutea.AAC.1
MGKRKEKERLRGLCCRNVDMILYSSLPCKCWSSEFLAACTGLDSCNASTRCVHSGWHIFVREYVVYIRERLQGVRTVEGG